MLAGNQKPHDLTLLAGNNTSKTMLGSNQNSYNLLEGNKKLCDLISLTGNSTSKSLLGEKSKLCDPHC